MNPEILQCYQDLANIVAPLSLDKWNIFRLEGEVDESGLGLSLEFISPEGVEVPASVPFEVFDIVEKIRALTPATLAWSKWIFECDRNGKYNISVEYPES